MGLDDILDRGRNALLEDGSEVAGRMLILDDLVRRRRPTPIYALQACDHISSLDSDVQPFVADALTVALALSDWSATTVFVPIGVQGKRKAIMVMLGVEPGVVSLCESLGDRLLKPAHRLDPVGRYAVMLLGQRGIGVERGNSGGHGS